MSKLKRMTVHKNIRQDGRPNGKAWKKRPKGFDLESGKLVTTGQFSKGKSE